MVWATSLASPGYKLPEDGIHGDVLPKHGQWLDDPALIYTSADVSIVVLPRRGGKLASIRDRTGREWLTQPQRDLLPLANLPDTLVDGDMFGWDECAPTIDDCEIEGRRIPLHGEVWNQPWSEGSDGWLLASGRVLDFWLARKLILVPHGFKLLYRAAATTRIPFLWAAHPQFYASPQTSVTFSDGSPQLVDAFMRGYWPDGGPRSPLMLKDVPEGSSAKVFADARTPVGSATLVQPDGATLTMRWEEVVAPYVGVWMDRGSIGRVDTIAIEPMTASRDSCANAANDGRVLYLKPHEPASWSLEVAIEPV